MKSSINICDLYVSLWVLYYMQGTLYEEGGFASMAVLLIIVAISFYYFALSFQRKKSTPYFKGLYLMIFLITIYGLLRLGSGNIWIGTKEIRNYTFLKDHYMSLLPIFVFYGLGRQGKIGESRLKIYTFVFYAVAIVIFFRMRREYYSMGRFDFTNNSAYMFVQVLPLLFLSKQKRLVEYLLALSLLLFTIVCMKRGAILIAVVMLGIAYWRSFKQMSPTSKLFTFIFLMVLFLVVWNFVGNLYLENEYFRVRIEDTQAGVSSGRDLIYEDLLDHLFHGTTTFEFLFGTGADSTLRFAENYAHNDWLEIATTMGILGVIAYLYYWIQFYKTIRFFNFDVIIKNTIWSIIIFCFIRTFFSMSINDMFVPLTCALGYSLSRV